jgi:alpha-L-arabinofuranosidase
VWILLDDFHSGAASDLSWPTAPLFLEDVYTVTDAVVFGSLMISLLKHADRVTSASLAQLGERDRTDHDRARRTGLATDHVLPVRSYLGLRRRPGRRRATAE